MAGDGGDGDDSGPGDDSDRGAGVDTEPHEGRRVVLVLYSVVVAIATGTGFLLGHIRPKGLDPELFGLVQLPPTPLGMAAYGGLTIALLLGALLGLVRYVSRFDDGEVA